MAPSTQHDSSDASPESTTASSDQPIQKAFSCALCAQRKVKCDRRPGGCDNCTKARLPCVYKAPPPPRRRKKGIRDVDTTTRLRIYEDALRRMGVDPEELVKQDPSGINAFLGPHIPAPANKAQISPEKGVLVQDDWWKSRYLENGIWTSLKSEFRESKEILDDSSDEDSGETEDGLSSNPLTPESSEGLLFGTQSTGTSLSYLHPQPVQIFKLWQAYLDNINPLVKVFHAPSIQQYISGACGNLGDVPRKVEVLMFAIYAITVESLGKKECMDILGESKTVARQRFRAATQQALLNASYLKSSNMMVLKALVLFILSLQDYDARIVWILSGVACRIGQRIGLHRDGEALGIPPFHAEMRRRLWWQIMLLEGFAQKLAGAGGTIAVVSDVKMPANLNDSDLFVDMKELPKDHEGATEMMFFLIRCHVGDFLKRSSSNQAYSFDGVWSQLTSTAIRVAAKDKAIDELEAILQRKFLQYCDPSIAWHLMNSFLGKCIIFMMRFMAHSTEYYISDIKQSEKDILFDLALQVISAPNLAYTRPEMQGFIWHINMHFQWKAFIYLLSELRYRTEGSQVEVAWEAIGKTYDFHPSFDKELSRRALPIAVNNLTMKAWTAYIAARGIPANGEPFFIQIIRSRQKQPRKQSEGSKQTEALEGTVSITPVAQNGKQMETYGYPEETNPLPAFDWNSEGWNNEFTITSSMPELLPLDNLEQMSWSTWDSLVMDFSTNGSSDAPIDLSTFNFGIQ